MDVQFVASVAPIVRDTRAARAFYADALGLSFEGGEGEYRFTQELDGTKHFGLWPLSEAATACFGRTEWPSEIPVPQASKEYGAGKAKVAEATVPETPSVLVDRLIGLTRVMSPAECESIVAQFAAAGLLPASNGATEISEELKERLQKLAPGKRLDQARALRILDVLIEFAWSLDQLVWEVWKNIAPRSIIRHDSGKHDDFRKTLGPYLTGDSEVSTEEVKKLVNKTRKLVSGLMAAMGTMGEIHNQKFLKRLSPDAIRRQAEAEPGVFESIEKKCWRKYTTIFAEMNEAAVEREILDAIKKYTEKLVLGADAAKTSQE